MHSFRFTSIINEHRIVLNLLKISCWLLRNYQSYLSYSYTVEPLLTDPPRSGLPLNNGHVSRNGMTSHRATANFTCVRTFRRKRMVCPCHRFGLFPMARTNHTLPRNIRTQLKSAVVYFKPPRSGNLSTPNNGQRICPKSMIVVKNYTQATDKPERPRPL